MFFKKHYNPSRDPPKWSKAKRKQCQCSAKCPFVHLLMKKVSCFPPCRTSSAPLVSPYTTGLVALAGMPVYLLRDFFLKSLLVVILNLLLCMYFNLAFRSCCPCHAVMKFIRTFCGLPSEFLLAILWHAFLSFTAAKVKFFHCVLWYETRVCVCVFLGRECLKDNRKIAILFSLCFFFVGKVGKNAVTGSCCFNNKL